MKMLIALFLLFASTVFADDIFYCKYDQEEFQRSLVIELNRDKKEFIGSYTMTPEERDSEISEAKLLILTLENLIKNEDKTIEALKAKESLSYEENEKLHSSTKFKATLESSITRTSKDISNTDLTTTMTFPNLTIIEEDPSHIVINSLTMSDDKTKFADMTFRIEKDSVAFRSVNRKRDIITNKAGEVIDEGPDEPYEVIFDCK
jgi:hypothetical protein